MGRATGIGGALLALALAWPSSAAAEEEDGLSPHPAAAIAAPEPTERLYPKAVSGFLLANGLLQSVPSAIPKNRTDYNLTTVVGASASGHPFEHIDYIAYVTGNLSTDAINGTAGSFQPEQIAVTYKPLDGFSVQGGYLRIPLSIGQATVIANSLFPTRAEPTALFQGGADAGLLASYESPEGRLRVKAGLFDGLSLRYATSNVTTKGEVLSGYAEVSPLGAMSPLEGDFKGSPFRFSLTGALVYRNGSAFAPNGYRTADFNEFRLALSLRAAVRGLYVQGEYLQSSSVNDIIGRRRISRGAYGEASYHVLPKERLGLAPMARLGWSEQDADFFPLHVITGHAGLALYPRGDLAQRGGVRLVIEYLSERHIEERETAYGGLASVMARF